nr:uncharacterized protein CI109_006662 [Kwoniella shandongensis]KAA5525022.1 hypothetical protein CI109_006662 [Kwoniella shandongensis]
MRLKLLLHLGAICATAAHVPLTLEIATSHAHQPAPSIESSSVEEANSPPTHTHEWSCDVRSWVRAPDLTPGVVHPAEARLAVNGSDCGDIQRWDVGLRFKERAIVKMKTKNISDFPVKPTRPAFNASMYTTGSDDHNDIYYVGGTWIHHDDDLYEVEYKNFTEAMKNKSLWEVHGAERVVLNLTQQLPLASIGETGIDEIQSFNVHVPNTNFPPIDARPSFSFYGQDEQTLNTETQMEYFHLLYLANGTILDIPAGKAAFLPAPSPIAPASDATEGSLNSPTWPVVLDLDSQYEKAENDTDNADEPWRFQPRRPDCDKGNLAHFRLHLTSDEKTVVQGQNVTLNITLTRTGNGSEYPSFLDISPSTSTNITWVFNYISTEKEYDALIGSDYRSKYNTVRRYNGKMEMLRVPSEEELERWRAQSERGGSGMSWSGNRRPLNRGDARYDIEKDQEEGKEEYNFELSLQTQYNDYPAFVTTFQTIQPTFSFNLYTNFLCEDNKNSNVSDPTVTRDEEWVEYRLPPRTTKKIRDSRGLPHRGSTPFNLISSENGNVTPTKEGLRHYLDPEALAPVLSLDTTPISNYPKLNTALREETESELVRSRHNPRYRNGNRVAGAWMHAARLWQGKERKQVASSKKQAEQSARLVFQN